MLQPAGKVCGFPASLRIYLRCSPIVCAMDAVFILIRFAFYAHHGYSSFEAAREIVAARECDNDDDRADRIRNEGPKQGRYALTDPNKNILLFYLVLGVGVITQFIKLMACSGIPWTQVWGCLYLLSFFVAEGTYRLAESRPYARRHPTRDSPLRLREEKIKTYEMACGVAAILLQLAVLASVDMKAIPPDPVLILRWAYIGVRLGAHFAVCLVHIPFKTLIMDANGTLEEYQWGFLLMSILVPHIILACTQGHRFSQLYFMISVIISYLSWMLYFFEGTKKFVLFCEPSQRKGWPNILAFDFFCRILCFSIFWYAIHYNPTGTRKPSWANYLG